MTDVQERAEVVVVGAGLAGLACALDLAEAGRDVRLVEASDGVGGRVRTDVLDGFQLDRGFQVILEAYPELRRRVSMKDLELRPFYPGALVRVEGAFHRMADPGLEMADALRSIGAPVGNFADKLRVARLRQEVLGGDPERLLEAPSGTTEELLLGAGFSSGMMDRFFRPFFGGVLLDPALQVSAKLFRYYFRMFAEGTSSLPSAGIRALPDQLASRLPGGVLRLEHPVRAVTSSRVELEGGGSIDAEAVVVAVEGPEASRLLGDHVPDPGSRGVTCLYFDAPESPVGEGILVLNGEGPGAGPVNNLAVVSDVARSYAPAGRALVSVTVVDRDSAGTEDLEADVRRHLATWYGGQVTEWRAVRQYRIEHAQPLQTPGHMEPPRRAVRLDDGLFVCGDHRENASLNGALASGGRAAREVNRALS
ncbi:MAG: FAD-dependent oxidoreductase [Gemmatimonadales bacterium]|nr:MAG: FAD-dependent oxidoreductase [Gemmatimonadales bacterium]